MTIISLLFLILRTKHMLELDLNVYVWLTVKSSQFLIIIFLFCNNLFFVAGTIVIVRAINKNWSGIKKICSEIILTELYMWTCLLDWFRPKTQNLKCALPQRDTNWIAVYCGNCAHGLPWLLELRFLGLAIGLVAVGRDVYIDVNVIYHDMVALRLSPTNNAKDHANA